MNPAFRKLIVEATERQRAKAAQRIAEEQQAKQEAERTAHIAFHEALRNALGQEVYGMLENSRTQRDAQGRFVMVLMLDTYEIALTQEQPGGNMLTLYGRGQQPVGRLDLHDSEARETFLALLGSAMGI